MSPPNASAASTASAASAALAWHEAIDKSGATYYYNDVSGATQYDRPEQLDSVPGLAEPLPAGWAEAKDNTGTPYYYHAVLGLSQYELPTASSAADASTTAEVAGAAGWRQAIDRRGLPFFYHETTRAAQYEPPGEHSALSGGAGDGWHIALDADGDEYYWNEDTMQTTYEPPPEPPPVPGTPGSAAAGGAETWFEWDPPLPPQRPAADEKAGGSSDRRAELGPPRELQGRIVEVEKEAMRLRGLLSDVQATRASLRAADAQASWERGVMRKAVRSSHSSSAPQPQKKPPLSAASSGWLLAQQKDAEELWRRRQERGRGGSKENVRQRAAERLERAGRQALAHCDYGVEVTRIKQQPSKGLGRPVRKAPPPPGGAGVGLPRCSGP